MSRTKLLIAVSSPWASQRQVAPIGELARRLDAEVVVAHVAHQKDEDENESDARRRGEETVKLLSDALVQAGVPSEAVLLFSDDVPKAILNTARARGCRIIVVGLSGKGAVKRLMSGDVALQVMRQSDIPVLACPPNWAGHI